MTSYKRVFTIKNPHGPGGVFFAWQRTSGGFLATTGYDQAIHIYNRSDTPLWPLADILTLC